MQIKREKMFDLFNIKEIKWKIINRMFFQNIFLLLLLFDAVISFYYMRYNSMIYTIQLSSNTASQDFISLLPFDLTFSNGIYPEYYIIGRSSKAFDTYSYVNQFTYLPGDIALLQDNTYVIFKEVSLYEEKSIYIGTINNSDDIFKSITGTNTNTKIINSEQNIFFYSTIDCSPYIQSINGETEIIVKMTKEKVDKYNNHEYYYEEINFSTRGTKQLSKVPPIYLNNSYLGNDCSIENDKYTVRCRIKDDKWFNAESGELLMYRVNEVYEGCYGPVYTGITLYIYGEANRINLVLLLIL